MFARVSCLESPRNGEAPLNLKKKDKCLTYVQAHWKFLLINIPVTDPTVESKHVQEFMHQTAVKSHNYV